MPSRCARPRRSVADDSQLPSEEELRDALDAIGVSDILLNALSVVASIGFRRVSAEERDLNEVRLAIETLRALDPVLRDGGVDEAVVRDLEQARANLQLAYASAVTERAPGSSCRTRHVDSAADDGLPGLCGRERRRRPLLLELRPGARGRGGHGRGGAQGRDRALCGHHGVDAARRGAGPGGPPGRARLLRRGHAPGDRGRRRNRREVHRRRGDGRLRRAGRARGRSVAGASGGSQDAPPPRRAERRARQPSRRPARDADRREHRRRRRLARAARRGAGSSPATRSTQRRGSSRPPIRTRSSSPSARPGGAGFRLPRRGRSDGEGEVAAGRDGRAS